MKSATTLFTITCEVFCSITRHLLAVIHVQKMTARDRIRILELVECLENIGLAPQKNLSVVLGFHDI